MDMGPPQEDFEAIGNVLVLTEAEVVSFLSLFDPDDEATLDELCTDELLLTETECTELWLLFLIPAVDGTQMSL